MINTTNIQQAINSIKSSKDKSIIVKAQNENFNRKILEYGKFHILLSPEDLSEKNSLRQINSGLNHVLAKIAAKNKIAIGIDFKEISNLEKKAKAERLSKIFQNIKICRKAKTKIAYKKNTKTNSLLLTLGASTQQIKEALPIEK